MRIAVAILTLCWGSQAAAQVVRIRVTDAASDQPVAGATIATIGQRVEARSDDAGRVVIPMLHAGANVFTVRRIGYLVVTTTLDVPPHDTLNVHVILQREAVALDTIAVNETVPSVPAIQVEAFERRRKLNLGGTFITRAQIDSSPPMQTLDLFRSVRGIEVHEKGMQHAITSRRGMVSTSDQCIMPVGRDGLVLGPGYDVNDIPANEIYGIEIYNGPASIPAEYRAAGTNGFCGLIMIWSRTGATMKKSP
jgi:hypothetical protein